MDPFGPQKRGRRRCQGLSFEDLWPDHAPAPSDPPSRGALAPGGATRPLQLSTETVGGRAADRAVRPGAADFMTSSKLTHPMSESARELLELLSIWSFGVFPPSKSLRAPVFCGCWAGEVEGEVLGLTYDYHTDYHMDCFSLKN